jgi:cytoskeletal protein RodZ
MPPTLGQRLKLAREARHLSHQDIAFQIKIPPARVKDLEEDSYTAFGSLTYARSFLKTYAAFLEVDASEILEHIQSPPLGGAGDYRYLTTDFGPWVDPDESSHQAMVPPRPSMRSSKSLVAAAVICSCILLAGVSVLIANSSLFKAKSPTQDPVASASLGEKKSPAADVTVMSAETKALQVEVPPRAIVVPDKNAPPPRAEIVQ